MKDYKALLVAVMSMFLMCSGPAVLAAEQVLKAVTFSALNKTNEVTTIFKLYVDRVNARGAGIIKIDLLGGPEIVPIRDQVTATSKGIVDMTAIFPVHAALVPEAHTVRLSKLSIQEERDVGFVDLLDEAHSKINIKVIGRASTESGFYIYTNKQIKSLEDFKGLKIRSHAGYDPFFKALGTNPIHMKTSEMYTALDRGLIEAAPNPIFVGDLGIPEVAKYALNNTFWGASSSWIYMNRARFDKLSEEAQTILLDVQLELEEEMAQIVTDMVAAEIKRLEEAGLEFIDLSDEDAEEWQRIAEDSFWTAFSEKLDPAQAQKIKNMILR